MTSPKSKVSCWLTLREKVGIPPGLDKSELRGLSLCRLGRGFGLKKWAVLSSGDPSVSFIILL